ncbi:MAG: endonuclease domain-containing protein [Gammaproteobacteria bacterium]|nr:endonuclease domain-containing protein [Gammaproteobacteria bacterium]
MAKGYLGEFTDKLRMQAKAFRKKPTTAESILWQALRNRKLAGYKFRRQVAIDRFIVDFYCSDLRLVVEVDGEVHFSQKDQDDARTKQLSNLGFRVIRFTNDQVYENLDSVTIAILKMGGESFPPLPFTGEGVGGEG